ncbi:uncharacterized protein LOC107260908 isoform X2 [Ricinus communis]|uniref:uncharacterized protein LOC107260908 isoform X2 n=1 Tax=Ricinus communis TaxID=3988 RepID=UPI00201A369D|nr:uncharacterized protein LOC107260908 isoform X2 [Ricinus communis]
MAAPACYTYCNFSPATNSLSNSKLKPINSLLCDSFFKPIISSKAHPFYSLPRLRVCQRKFASLTQKRSQRLVVALSGLVDGNSETYPEAEPTDLNAGTTIDTKLPRRSLLVQFTCGECGERTQRLINRLAYERGLVYVQDVKNITN